MPFGLNKYLVAKWHIDNEDYFSKEIWRDESIPHSSLDHVGINFDFIDAQH